MTRLWTSLALAQESGENDLPGLMALIFPLVLLVVLVLMVAGAWRVFAKAGRPGWAALIPVYNAIVLIQIAHRPVWWFFLLLIPVVGIVPALLIGMELARHFGKSPALGVGLALLPFVFFPILGFGASEYRPKVPPP